MYRHRLIYKKLDRKFRPERYDHQKEVGRWYADGGDKKFRFSYPLNKNSVVLDAGGYDGSWSQEIYKLYQCNIYTFEPIKKYYGQIQKKFSDKPKIKVYNLGLGGKSRRAKMSIEDVASSIFKKGTKTEVVQIVDIKQFCQEHKLTEVDLFKINIEGGEYELLNRFIDTGLVKNIRHLQIQFHNFFPDAEEQMEKIQIKLSRTHKLTYQYWFVWDNWKRKGIK